MVNPSTEYSESRPFKIFVSLLDKWEVGGPLTEVLVYTALKAIERHVEMDTESSEDVGLEILPRTGLTCLLGENDREHSLRGRRASGGLETAPEFCHV